MKDLFSTTTHTAPRSHTEIVEAIKNIDVVDCDLFYTTVGRAITAYFEHEKPLYRQVPDRTRTFARAVSEAVKKAVEYVSQEDEPALSLEETVNFEPLQLSTNDAGSDGEMDQALSGILKSMDGVTYYQHGNQETFMFRVSMENGLRESLIPEITRTDQSFLHRPDKMPNVTYDLTFAAFED
jgi:hypothetical protein